MGLSPSLTPLSDLELPRSASLSLRCTAPPPVWSLSGELVPTRAALWWVRPSLRGRGVALYVEGTQKMRTFMVILQALEATGPVCVRLCMGRGGACGVWRVAWCPKEVAQDCCSIRSPPRRKH